MLNLRTLFNNYHDTAKSFSELVPWMSQVAPDMVLNLDGSLMVCYTFEGVDAEGIETIDSDRYADLLEHALKVCDEHMTVWATVDRRRITEYPESHFESEMASRMDAAWKKMFTSGNQYANRHYFTFMYAPAKGTEGFFESVTAHLKTQSQGMFRALVDTSYSFLSKERAIQNHFKQLGAMKTVFLSKMREFEETVAELSFRRLVDDDLLSFLHTRCSPASAGQPIAKPEVPAYLNTWLPDNTLLRDHDYLVFKDVVPLYVMGATVKWNGGYARPGVMDALLRVPGEITISQCFRFVNQDKAKKHIDDLERHHRSQAKSMMTMAVEQATGEPSEQIDTGKLVLAAEAQGAKEELTVHARAYGYYNMTVLAYGSDLHESEETLKQVSTAIRQQGFVLVRETLHLLSAFCGTMPGQWAKLVRWAFLNIANVADLALIRTLDIGDKQCAHLTSQTGRPLGALTVVQTEHSTPYYFDPYKEHLAHTLVVGPSRTGKSAYVNFVISQFGKYAPCNRFIFDKDYSCKIPTLLQGGKHVDMDLRSSNCPRLNPIQLLVDRNNWIWLAKWLKGIATARGYILKPDDDVSIRKAMEMTAAQPQEKWRLDTLVDLIDDKVLATQFQEWVGDGSFGKFFDNAVDDFALSDFVCIEMGGLLDTDVAGPFMDYAFFRINQKLTGSPTLIYVEECWFMLKDPTFAEKLDDWLRTLAKKNAFVIMATQSLNEIANSSIFGSIIDNIKNRIYLPNADAFAHRHMYMDMFGLNEAQIHRIATAIPKQHYYIVTSTVSRMAVIRFPKDILGVVRSDAKAQKIFDRWYQQREERSDWDEQYLREVNHA